MRLEYESCWQGYVDIDVELADGRVFSYKYEYGSCIGCDLWEAMNLSKEEIKEEMLKGAAIFDSMDDYLKWRKQVEKTKRRGGVF